MVRGSVVLTEGGLLGHILGPAVVEGAVVVALDEDPTMAKVVRVAELDVVHLPGTTGKKREREDR